MAEIIDIRKTYNPNEIINRYLELKKQKKIVVASGYFAFHKLF